MEGRLDPARVHFLGRLPHRHMLAVLSISAAHVYYTYPFVLSWSLLEAMASECLIVASDTAPVRDAIRHGENGLLLGFFDREALAAALVEACRRPADFAALRRRARATVIERFNRADCTRAWMRLLEEVGGG
jgi:glycosyltransferase involved in cell wall biosynthesis